MEKLILDYFYDRQGEQFQYILLPKILIKDEMFQNLSSDAKILYSLFLERTNLSFKNKWLDEENRVYIIFKVKEIMESLIISKMTAIKVLKELDDIGLIERKKQDFGKPDLIYVKDFTSLFRSRCKNYTSRGIKNVPLGYKNYTSEVKNLDPINKPNINKPNIINQSINHRNLNIYNNYIDQNEGEIEGLCQELESCDFIYQKINDNYTETVNQGDTSYELLKVIADKVKNDSEMIKIQGKFIHKSCVLEKLNEYFDNYEEWLDVLERITDVDKKRGIKNKYKFILTSLYEETILPNSSKRKRQFGNNQKSEEEIEEFLKILNTGNDILKYIEPDEDCL